MQSGAVLVLSPHKHPEASAWHEPTAARSAFLPGVMTQHNGQAKNL